MIQQSQEWMKIISDLHEIRRFESQQIVISWFAIGFSKDYAGFLWAVISRPNKISILSKEKPKNGFEFVKKSNFQKKTVRNLNQSL